MDLTLRRRPFCGSSPMREPKNLIATYFLTQATLIAAWWALLWSYAPSIRWFLPDGAPASALTTFWLPDAVMLVGGSLVAAVAIWRQARWAATAVWSLAVVSWYPTLWCLATSLASNEGWIATALMATMASVSLAMATICGSGRRPPATIRVVPMSRTQAVASTFGQLVIFWSLFLWILPRGIDEAARHLGMQAFHHPAQSTRSFVLLALASMLGIWSALTISLHGHGSPLPTATAPTFVIAGPYRWIRNPMAMAGIAQGLAVGWYLGSIAVIGYALCGAMVWQFVVRPVEERDLVQRFGTAYLRYRDTVPLWFPAVSRHLIHVDSPTACEVVGPR